MYYQVKWCQKTSEIFSAVPLEIQSLFHRGNQSLIHYIWCPFVGYLQIQRLEGRYDAPLWISAVMFKSVKCFLLFNFHPLEVDY